MARQFFVGGNFKMNGSLESVRKIVGDLNEAKIDDNVEVVVAPPAIFLIPTKEHVTNHVQVAAQNVYHKHSGAFTGEIGIDQLKDAKIPWVILGHSERRTLFCESDEMVAEKTEAVLGAGLKVILCVGETLQQREAGETMAVVTRQLGAVASRVSNWDHIVIAYEPVWAIGTGKTATAEQAQEVHAAIRQWVAKQVNQNVADSIRVIYGGSVAAKNSKELSQHPDIDGFLVGGASLKPEFKDIINSRA